MDMHSGADKEGNKEKTTTASAASKANMPMVRLANFSVKEYLVSDQIHEGLAAFFKIDEKVSNTVVGDMSLSCLLLYDESSISDSEGFSRGFRLRNPC